MQINGVPVCVFQCVFNVLMAGAAYPCVDRLSHSSGGTKEKQVAELQLHNRMNAHAVQVDWVMYPNTETTHLVKLLPLILHRNIMMTLWCYHGDTSFTVAICAKGRHTIHTEYFHIQEADGSAQTAKITTTNEKYKDISFCQHKLCICNGNLPANISCSITGPVRRLRDRYM